MEPEGGTGAVTPTQMSQPEREPTDDELIDRARRGEAAAWEMLYRRHWDRLHAAALKRLAPLLRQRVGASDVVQEALLELFRAPPRVEIEPGHARAWLDAVVDHMVLRAVQRHCKTKRRSVRNEDHGRTDLDAEIRDQRSPSGELAAVDEAERMNRAIARLPETDQIVVRLRNWEDLTFPEIAQVIGKTEAAVGVQYRRALAKLHDLLDDDRAA